MKPVRMLAAALCAMAVPALAAEPPQPFAFAVPGHVEMAAVATTARLELPWVPYGVGLSGERLDTWLAREAHDPAEAALARLLTALREGDAEAAAPFLDGDAEATVSLWHQAFGGFADVTIIGRAPLGPADLFLWQVETERGPFPRAFALRSEGQGFRATLTSSTEPVATLLVQSVSDLMPEAHGPAGAGQSIALPILGAKGQAILRFDGDVMAVPVFEGDLSAAPEVVRVYAETLRMARDGDLDGFIARHTEGSAAKLRQQLDGAGRDAFLQTLLQPRTVRLVIDGGAVVWLFHAADADDAPLRHDTLARTPDGYRLTNFYYGSHIDRVFETVFPKTPAALDADLR